MTTNKTLTFYPGRIDHKQDSIVESLGGELNKNQYVEIMRRCNTDYDTFSESLVAMAQEAPTVNDLVTMAFIYGSVTAEAHAMQKKKKALD